MHSFLIAAIVIASAAGLMIMGIGTVGDGTFENSARASVVIAERDRLRSALAAYRAANGVDPSPGSWMTEVAPYAEGSTGLAGVDWRLEPADDGLAPCLVSTIDYGGSAGRVAPVRCSEPAAPGG